MARGNTYTCKTCGKTYEFCPKCAITKPDFDAENFCTHNHNDIFAILSKHGCNIASAEETLNALEGYDLTGVTEDIQRHIDALQPQKKVEAKETVENVFKITQQSNKK